MSQIRPIGSSLIGRVYIPSSPPLQASDNGVIAFPTSLALELEFRLMLESTHNRGIFTQAKEATYVAGLRILTPRLKATLPMKGTRIATIATQL
jgi:hypothetical protein